MTCWAPLTRVSRHCKRAGAERRAVAYPRRAPVRRAHMTDAHRGAKRHAAQRCVPHAPAPPTQRHLWRFARSSRRARAAPQSAAPHLGNAGLLPGQLAGRRRTLRRSLRRRSGCRSSRRLDRASSALGGHDAARARARQSPRMAEHAAQRAAHLELKSGFVRRWERSDCERMSLGTCLLVPRHLGARKVSRAVAAAAARRHAPGCGSRGVTSRVRSACSAAAATTVS